MTRYFNQPDQKQKRQQLRQTMSKPEVILWSKLKNRQLLGLKFRRQVSIGAYLLDFYCPDVKVAVELDGESHYIDGAQDYDAKRDGFIRSFGIEILRVLNDEVFENLDGVWEYIARVCRDRLGASPEFTHLPLPPLKKGGSRTRRRRGEHGRGHHR